MLNPFRYGGIVEKESFCNRKRELRELRRAAENADRLFVVAGRRMGKTSLVQRAIGSLPKSRFVSAYVDLWATDDETSFVTATAEAIARGVASKPQKLLEAASQFFGTLQPSLTVDSQGSASLRFGIRTAKKGRDLREILKAPQQIAERRKRRVVIVFDEFQRIAEYADDVVERTLRSSVQQHKDVAYLFLGSRRHLIQRMFLDAGRPLYRAAGHFPLGCIDTNHWIPFIRSRFNKARKRIDDSLITELCTLTEGHPFYTQHLAHVLWERTESGAIVQANDLEDAVDILLDREGYAYTMLWESLTANQQRFLRGLASGAGEHGPYSASFVEASGLRTPSNAQRAAASLVDRDVIERHNGSYEIADRFFRLWLQRLG